jgi:ABC-2 type transport system ATP-binding protein
VTAASPPDRTAPLIEADRLTRRYGSREVVRGVSFAVYPGEVVGLLGANGAGKTTTLRMLAGVLAPSAGTARLSGHDVSLARIAAQRSLGYVPEGAPLPTDISVRGWLGFLARAQGWGGDDLHSAVASALAGMTLEAVADADIGTLSKGFRRRVALAGALLTDARCLILDEPTDGLDPLQKQAMRAKLSALARGRAILISTHALDELAATCTRVLVLSAGVLVADTTPRALAEEPGGLEAAFARLSAPEEVIHGAR